MSESSAENGSPRWRWDHEQLMQGLRADHESAYRELREHERFANTRFDRIDTDFRALLTIPVQVESLAKSIGELAGKLDALVTNNGASRRADWNMALVAIGILLSVLLGTATFLVSLLRTGVVH